MNSSERPRQKAKFSTTVRNVTNWKGTKLETEKSSSHVRFPNGNNSKGWTRDFSPIQFFAEMVNRVSHIGKHGDLAFKELSRNWFHTSYNSLLKFFPRPIETETNFAYTSGQCMSVFVCLCKKSANQSPNPKSLCCWFKRNANITVPFLISLEPLVGTMYISQEQDIPNTKLGS